MKQDRQRRRDGTEPRKLFWVEVGLTIGPRGIEPKAIRDQGRAGNWVMIDTTLARPVLGTDMPGTGSGTCLALARVWPAGHVLTVPVHFFQNYAFSY